MSMKVRKGDQVKVIAGKDRGKTGTIEAVLPDRGRVVVTGVNILKKAVKPTAQTRQAGLVDFPAPLHASNVMVLDPKSGEASRVGYKVTGTGKTRRKIRIAKKSGTELTIIEEKQA
jgi:large subunit ribosomal protein L24